MGRTLSEGEGEVGRVVVDEAAVGWHDDVAERRLHEVLQGVVAKRLQQSRSANSLLMSVVFEAYASQEDDDFAAETAHFCAFLKAVLGVVEDKEEGSEKGRTAVNGFLSGGRATCASATST